jgi:hypothetical protein
VQRFILGNPMFTSLMGSFRYGVDEFALLLREFYILVKLEEIFSDEVLFDQLACMSKQNKLKISETDFLIFIETVTMKGSEEQSLESKPIVLSLPNDDARSSVQFITLRAFYRQFRKMETSLLSRLLSTVEVYS